MKFSIIIPSYNHLDDCLKPCLESLLKYTDLSNGEIIIVLNGCTDNSYEWCNSLNNDKIKILNYNEALGYTKAINIGIKESKGEYVILLNNDTEILQQNTNDWIDRLINSFSDNVGATGITKIWDEASGWDFLIFFCVCLRKDLLEKYGYLDEIYNPGGCEDIEYCIRLQKLGFSVKSVSELTAKWSYATDYPIYHKGERTVWELKQWNEIWNRNVENIKKYKEDLQYSIFIDECDIQILDNIRQNTNFSAKEIVIKNEEIYNQIKQFGPYRLVRDKFEWYKKIPIGVKRIYIKNFKIENGPVDYWLNELDKGLGFLYHFAANKEFLNNENYKYCWWIWDGHDYNISQAWSYSVNSFKKIL